MQASESHASCLAEPDGTGRASPSRTSPSKAARALTISQVLLWQPDSDAAGQQAVTAGVPSGGDAMDKAALLWTTAPEAW